MSKDVFTVEVVMLEYRRLTNWDFLTQELRDRLGIIMAPRDVGRCFMCGRATVWIDICYEAYLCSPYCDHTAREDAARC